MKLETIYLANVVLYLTDIQSVLRFKQINKKCQEATLMIRIYSIHPQHQQENMLPNQEEEQLQLLENEQTLSSIPPNLFDIFPKLETIEYYLGGELQQMPKLLKKAKRIRTSFDDWEYPIEKSVAEKIDTGYFYIGTNIISYPYRVSEFPNMRTMIIETYYFDHPEYINDDSIENELLPNYID